MLLLTLVNHISNISAPLHLLHLLFGCKILNCFILHITYFCVISVLQTLNQRPSQGLAGLQGLQNKVPDLGLGPGSQVSLLLNQKRN